ncbi:MAG: methyltransferase domain-containing protein, partial [Gemmatimonadales bacterium]
GCREVEELEEGCIAVVRGKHVISMDGAALRIRATAALRVVVDLGAGDGRWIYRLARLRPDWLCVAVDANAAGLREASRRAARKASRGGAPNAWFLRAPAEALPSALSGLADEIHIHFPWGSLLRGVLEPRPPFLAGIARLGKPGAALSICVNQSALDDILGSPRLDRRRGGHDLNVGSLAGPYAAAGIDLAAVDRQQDTTVTTWGRRLGAGRLPEVWALVGRVKEIFPPRVTSRMPHRARGTV